MTAPRDHCPNDTALRAPEGHPRRPLPKGLDQREPTNVLSGPSQALQSDRPAAGSKAGGPRGEALRRTSVRGLLEVVGLIRFGRAAPRAHELIWVPTVELQSALVEPTRSAMSKKAGRIVGGDWDLDVGPLHNYKMRYCIQRWTTGVSWEETGAYDRAMQDIQRAGGSYDGCSTLDDVRLRYRNLDNTFDQVRRTGRLNTRSEVAPGTIRERGGIGVHVGRQAQPIWGRDGSHRIAMALVLELPVIPARLMAVHRDAVPAWCRLLEHPLGIQNLQSG